MASPLRLKGYNSALEYSSSYSGGALVAPTPLSALAKIKLPSAKRAIVNTYDLATTSTITSTPQVKTSQPGWFDTDKIDVVAYFTQAQFTALLNLFEAGTEYYWQCTLAVASGQMTPANLQFPGYISEIGIDELNTDDDNLVMVPFSIKINDIATFTGGS
jgi:hypothetical protein